MKRGFKVIAVFISCLLLIACGANSLEKQLDLGQKYLEEQNYEDALAAFTKAIEIDSKNVAAYLGAADAYLGMEDYENAISILEVGYKETSDESIAKKIEEIKKLISSIADSSEESEVLDDNAEEEEQENSEEDSLSVTYNAYADYLESNSLAQGFSAGTYTKQGDYGVDQLKFLPIYLDGDETPELVYSTSNEYIDEVHVLKIIDGKVVDIGQFEGGTTVWYLPERGIIRNEVQMTFDYYTDEYYNIDNNGKLTLMASASKYYENGVDLSEEPDEEDYYLGPNNEATSKDNFYSYINGYDNDPDNPYILLKWDSDYAVNDAYTDMNQDTIAELRNRTW